MKEYKALYTKEDDAWIVKIDGVPGCHSYGKTLEKARENIAEALSLFESESVLIEHVIKR